MLIQNLLYTDIRISDIIHQHSIYNYRIIISVHDFIWLCDNVYNYTDEVASAYLEKIPTVRDDTMKLFNIAHKIITNSQFTHRVYSKYIDNLILSYPNDYKIQNNIINIPEIRGKCINIGIFTYLCKYKGEKYVKIGRAHV